MPKSDNLETLKRTLAKMARRSDRETPYAFAGRKAERAHFRRRTESLPPYDGGAGGTTLITGAPGAGKTALMAQAVEDFREARPGTVEVKVPSQSAVAPASGFERFLREVAHRLTGGADPSAPDRPGQLIRQGRAQHRHCAGRSGGDRFGWGSWQSGHLRGDSCRRCPPLRRPASLWPRELSAGDHG